MQSDAEYEAEEAIWEDVFDRLSEVLDRFGVEGTDGDFWVHDCYGGFPQAKYYAADLKMMSPPVVAQVQQMLTAFPPEWEVVVAVAIPPLTGSRPNMGLWIRAGEVVVDLQPKYLPAAYRDLSYPTGRPKTAADG